MGEAGHAGGFRNKQNFVNAIYFHCGGLNLGALIAYQARMPLKFKPREETMMAFPSMASPLFRAASPENTFDGGTTEETVRSRLHFDD